MPPRDIALALCVVVLWGYNFVPIKLALLEVPPFALAALRFLVAAVPMVFFVRRPACSLPVLVGYGLAIGVGQFGLLFLSIRLGMPAGLASLLIQLQVFFTIALSVRYLGERIGRHNLMGAVLAGAGVTLLAFDRLRSGGAATLAGTLLILVAAGAWAAGNVLAKHAARRQSSDMFRLVVWSSLVAPLPLGALSYATEGEFAPLRAIAGMSLLAWGCVLFMAIAGTLFGFAVWNALLHRHPSAAVSPFALLIPVVGLACGVLFLGETLNAFQAGAAVFVLAGLVVNVAGSRWLGPRAGLRNALLATDPDD